MKGLLVICLALLVVPAIAQPQARTSDRNQVIKLVLTPKIIYSNAYVFSYERVIKPYQSLNITGGVIQLPSIFSGTDHFVTESEKGRGYTAGFDYRFYLKGENKYSAPRGVYIGPFLSYYWLKNERLIRDPSNTGSPGSTFDSKISLANLGFQVGYQFVINDRWSFDVIFIGPSLTHYKMKLNLDGNFTVDQENEIIKKLMDSFPLLGQFIDEGSLTLHGVNSSWAPGYRFSAMVGYKFGFGKKKR